MSEHDTTNDASQDAVGDPNAAPDALLEIPRRRAPAGTMPLRVVALLLTVALLGGWQWTRGRALEPAALGLDPGATVVLTLLPGANYGAAAVYLGLGADGPPLADDAAITAAVLAAAGDGGNTEIVIQAAGSVLSGEVARVHDAALAASPDHRNMRVHWSLLPAE
ncbi:MAG TPA: hypothetical protein VMV69_01435 [Pirellulales bacterium]|nr:hypothetical protein [Pirellulales bacterium]